MRVRRRHVLAALAALQLPLLRAALAAGSVEKGVARVKGDARINGAPAKEGMDVKAGDVVTTGPDGEIVFAHSNWLAAYSPRVVAVARASQRL